MLLRNKYWGYFMSLNIFTNISSFSHSNFIFDVESGFRGCGIRNTDYNKKVLKIIENGSYINKSKFLDRFGVMLYSTSLSTSSKAYMCLDSFPEKVINFSEVGNKTGNLLFDKDTGGIYIPKYRLGQLFCYSKDKSIDIS